MVDQCLTMIPQHQWVSKLIRFDFRVEYHPDATNVITDTLSYRNTEAEAEVEAGSRSDKWAIVDDLVGGYVYVSLGSPSLQAILSATHGIGHEGSKKTLHHLRTDFFDPARAWWCVILCRFCDVPPLSKDGQSKTGSLRGP
jgi:hypothetical protein